MSSCYNITLLPGDGIGPEVIQEALKLLQAVEDKYKIMFTFTKAEIGGCAIDQYGTPLPESTLKKALEADAVLMGSIGDFKYDTLPPDIRPEKGLLALRSGLEVFANLRPALVYDELAMASTLKEEVVKGTDIVIVRELTGGVYFGQPKGKEVLEGKLVGYNTMKYTEDEIVRIAHVAFKIAQKRDKRLCSVDKANVLDVSQVWRDVVTQVSKSYPNIELSHMYVDNAAMQLIRNPKQFDVILTENLFGDILSDEAAMLTGSLGMLPSASVGDGSKPSLYEPVHGSAPDIKGQGKANPIATILSAAMMFKYSFNQDQVAQDIEQAVKNTLKSYRTQDIYNHEPDVKLVSTSDMGHAVIDEFLKSPVLAC